MARARTSTRSTKSTKTTAVVFSSKAGTPLGTIALTGIATKLHQSPERIREVMTLLDLPKGTRAQVFAKATTVIIR